MNLEQRKQELLEFIQKANESKYIDDEYYQPEYIIQQATDLLTCIEALESITKFVGGCTGLKIEANKALVQVAGGKDE